MQELHRLPIDPRNIILWINVLLGDGRVNGRTGSVQSEKMVRSSHSARGDPETIEEVKRILKEQTGLR